MSVIRIALSRMVTDVKNKNSNELREINSMVGELSSVILTGISTIGSLLFYAAGNKDLDEEEMREIIKDVGRFIPDAVEVINGGLVIESVASTEISKRNNHNGPRKD